MKLIPLTHSHFAMVDDADYAEMSKYNWQFESGYARTAIRVGPGRQSQIRMHRMLLDAPPGSQIDHKDRNGLNNQRENIRFCTASQNMSNRRKPAGVKSSSFRGVSLHRRTGKYQVDIQVDNRKLYLGLFTDEVDAATVYNFAVEECFGEFASYNQPL